MRTTGQFAEFMKKVPVRSRTLLRYTIRLMYRYYAVQGFASLTFERAYYRYHYQAQNSGTNNSNYYTVYVEDVNDLEDDYYINEYHGNRHYYAKDMLRYEHAMKRKGEL